MANPVTTETAEGALPLILYTEDLAVLARRSRRAIDRLKRAKQLPDPLPIPGRPCWAREDILAWLSTAGRRRR